MPSHLPDYPNHEQIAAYFDAYVDHFGFREHIRFRTEVKLVEAAPEGGWNVTLEDGTTTRYDAVLVANGHHWDARWPDPPFPGEFNGRQLHAHDYKTPEGMEGQNVLVLGIGNSATDIAVETSRVANMTYLAMRRGAYVIPKYLKGRPTDELGTELTSRLPLAVQRYFYARALKTAQGDMESYGLPTPDHKLLEAHPTISSDLCARIGHGRVTVKPNVERFEGDHVRFTDGTTERVDTIVYCTGYKISFPFLPADMISAPDNRVPLYRRVVDPEHPGPLLHRADPAAGGDHADRGAAGRMGRRHPRGQGPAALARGDARRDPARGRAHGEALRALSAAHDPGGLLSVHAHVAARAQARAPRRAHRPARAALPRAPARIPSA